MPNTYKPRSLKGLGVDELRMLLPAKKLSVGGHSVPFTDLNKSGQMCVMEAVAYITDEEHTDHPKCADPALTDIAISFNDAHRKDAERDKLIAAIPALVGSKTKSPRVRWKRLKLMARKMLQKSIEWLNESYEEAPSLNLIGKIEEASHLRTKDDARVAFETLREFAEVGGVVGDTLDLLGQMVKHWDSNGITGPRYEILMPTDLTEIFKDPGEQAQLLIELGSVRS